MARHSCRRPPAGSPAVGDDLTNPNWKKRYPPVPTRNVRPWKKPPGAVKKASTKSTPILPVSELRRAKAVTLTWQGGSEPWIKCKVGDAEFLCPPGTLVWELVLRLSGYQ